MMIKLKWLKLYEEYTGIFKSNSKGLDMIFKLDIKENMDGLLDIKLILDDKIYDDLSIIIPDSSKLGKGEFYLNPDIDIDIIEDLIDQNFITKLNKSGIVGDKHSNVYILNI